MKTHKKWITAIAILDSLLVVVLLSLNIRKQMTLDNAVRFEIKNITQKIQEIEQYQVSRLQSFPLELSNAIQSIHDAVQELYYLFDGDHLDEKGRFSHEIENVLKVLEDTSKYSVTIPLDLVITTDGKTFEDLCLDIFNCVKLEWMDFCADSTCSRSAFASFCIRTFDSIERMMEYSYQLPIMLDKNTCIFSYFTTLELYVDNDG